MNAARAQFPARRRRQARGSTLLEVAIIVVIVGVAITAILQFTASATQTNRSLNEYYIATALARTGQEWAGARSEAQLLAFFGEQTQKAAADILDVSGDVIENPAYSGYSQTFSYRKVSDTNPAATDGEGELYEVTVTIRRGTATICTLTRLHDLS